MKQTFVVLITYLLLIPVSATAQDTSYRIMESFEDGIPATMRAEGGNLGLDSLRFKHGRQALRWKWIGNSKLVLERDLGYHPQRTIDIRKDSLLKELRGGGKSGLLTEPPRGFFLWIYNPQARAQQLRFQFGRDDQVDAEFDFELNFSGWRTIWIIYDKGDMMGVPQKDMNRMTVLAPNIGQGSFVIDALGTSLPMNFRQNNPNPQLPQIDMHPRLVSQYEHRLFEWSRNLPTRETRELSDQDLGSLEEFDRFVEQYLIEQYLFDVSGEEGSSRDDSIDPIGPIESLEDLESRFSEFKIKRDGSEIYGRPLMSSNVYLEYFEQAGMPREELIDEFISWKTYGSLLKDLAISYRMSKDAAQRKQMETMFVDLFDYGIDQGIDEGVGLSWMHHYAYRLNAYPEAVFMMRDVLQEYERREKAVAVLKWFYGFNRVYNEEVVYGAKGRKGIDADDAHGVLLGTLLSAMTMENSPEKDRDLRQFSSFFSNVTAQPSNAIDDGIKTDGTAFHHAVHVPSYGTRLVNGLARMNYLLSNSPFEASRSAQEHVRKSVNTLFFFQGPGSFKTPVTFSHTRFSIEEIPQEARIIPALMALSGDPESDEAIDQSMVGFAKYQLGLSTGLEHSGWRQKLDSAAPAIAPQTYDGVRILPYSGSLIKRSGDRWMASLRTHSKYVIPFESWGADFFAYPLFMANGMLEISYPNSLESSSPDDEGSRWFSGYDWRRWPGTTSVRLPFDEMITMPEQIRQEGGEYLTSDQAFCGGVETDEGTGIFAFVLHGHDKYRLQSLRGKKSYFAFDDYLVCLGSGIESDLDGLEVETTVFQDFLKEPTLGTMTDRGEVADFPMMNYLTTRGSSWMIDSRGTGFFIPGANGESKLKFSRDMQSSPDGKGRGMQQGNYASLVFDHGVKPRRGSYAYAVIPQADEERMKDFDQEMRSKQRLFKVLRKDESAHMVEDTRTGQTGYVCFEPNTTFQKGWVKEIVEPAILLIRKQGSELNLHLANPDLNIYDGQDDLMPDGSRTELSIYEREWFFWPSRPVGSSVLLKGKWKIKESEVESQVKLSYERGGTLLEFLCREGMTQKLVLTR